VLTHSVSSGKKPVFVYIQNKAKKINMEDKKKATLSVKS